MKERAARALTVAALALALVAGSASCSRAEDGSPAASSAAGDSVGGNPDPAGPSSSVVGSTTMLSTEAPSSELGSSTSIATLAEPEAETNVDVLADFVERRTGLLFSAPPVIDYSAPDPSELNLDADFFADEEMWRLLTVFGLITPQADRIAAAQARIEQIRGACCPVQLYDTDDHPLLTSVVAVHELTHLVDEGRMEQMPFGPEDEVVGLARAVSEGNAQRVALDYQQLLEDIGAAPDRFVVGWSHPDIPDAFLQILEFPYEEGYLFSAQLEEIGGLDQVAESFRRPPLSSKQILDVDSYLSAERPTPVRPPDSGQGEPIQRGVVGAFLLKLLLEQTMSASAAVDLATQWSGDSYTVFDGEGDTCVVVDMVMESVEATEQLRRVAPDLDLDAATGENGSLRLSRCTSD